MFFFSTSAVFLYNRSVNKTDQIEALILLKYKKLNIEKLGVAEYNGQIKDSTIYNNFFFQWHCYLHHSSLVTMQ